MFSDEVTDLMRRTSVLQSAHSLIGSQTYRTWAGQIALRYPGDHCLPSMKQQDGALAQHFIRKGLESLHQAQQQSGGGQYANMTANDDGFMVLPKWETRWHVDG
jgi:hypothetical protein